MRAAARGLARPREPHLVHRWRLAVGDAADVQRDQAGERLARNAVEVAAGDPCGFERAGDGGEVRREDVARRVAGDHGNGALVGIERVQQAASEILLAGERPDGGLGGVGAQEQRRRRDLAADESEIHRHVVALEAPAPRRDRVLAAGLAVQGDEVVARVPAAPVTLERVEDVLEGDDGGDLRVGVTAERGLHHPVSKVALRLGEVGQAHAVTRAPVDGPVVPRVAPVVVEPERGEPALLVRKRVEERARSVAHLVLVHSECSQPSAGSGPPFNVRSAGSSVHTPMAIPSGGSRSAGIVNTSS